MNPFKISSSPPTSSDRELARQMLRTVSLFQAIAAFPGAVFLGFAALISLIFSVTASGFYYDFFTNLVASLMCGGIIFVVIVQRRTTLNATKTLTFEATKSGLATGLWLWMLLDSIFASHNYGGDGSNQAKNEIIATIKRARVARTITAVILLLLLFYPALAYSYLQWKRLRDYRDPEHQIELEDCDTMLDEDEEALLTRMD